MDPNDTLEALRAIVKDILREGECIRFADEIEFAELFESLDRWLRLGGALPESWRR